MRSLIQYLSIFSDGGSWCRECDGCFNMRLRTLIVLLVIPEKKYFSFVSFSRVSF
jgi:hypothetical protein